jgi:hypothetical protein
MFLKLAAIAFAALTLGGCLAMMEEQAIARNCGPDNGTAEWMTCSLAARGPARAPIPIATGGGSSDRRPINCTSSVLAGTVVTTCN